MSTNLASILLNFHNHAKRMRDLLKDTRNCFREINNNESNFSDLQFHAIFQANEELNVEKSIRGSPGIVILGQNFYSKAYLANLILGENLFPIEKISLEQDRKWRMIEVSYSEEISFGMGVAGTSLELANHLAANDKPWGTTIPIDDLLISLDQEEEDDCSLLSFFEVKIENIVLKSDVFLTISQTGYGSICEIVEKCSSDCVPIFLFAFSNSVLSLRDLEDLQEFKKLSNETILFIKVPVIPFIYNEQISTESSSDSSISSKNTISTRSAVCSLTASNISSVIYKHFSSVNALPEVNENIDEESESSNNLNLKHVFQQLLELGYLSALPNNSELKVESELCDSVDNSLDVIANYANRVLTSHILRATSSLNKVHTRCLQIIINVAFDMARDVLITPRKLDFVKKEEDRLFKGLTDIIEKNLTDIQVIINQTLSNLRGCLLQLAEDHEFLKVDLKNGCNIKTAKVLRICTGEIEDLVLSKLNVAISGKLLSSIEILNNNFTGVLQRCVQNLERTCKENLENSNTTNALSEILTCAYQVDITQSNEFSLLKILSEKMKQLIQSMPWRNPPTVSKEWKRRVAEDMLNSLDEEKLSKTVQRQIHMKLKNSHCNFATALKHLESRHFGRLSKTEDQRVKVRKIFAPQVARLALESVSMHDFIMYGMPNYTKEIGRGQYGVVYSCDSWGELSPCAIKSIVPPDDRHWNDLALEFYYTKCIPEHERVVGLYGSIIDYSYANGTGTQVLLIMPKFDRDLYTAIKTGLDWVSRLRIAIDVVEAIRYLHSLGLVHRDVKLKNVLLDKMNRGKLTDLGFCKPEAMISGSIVGTPIHMAPELFHGRYDNTVDIYAFGILFWYICAGHVRLPYAYEMCSNKDMLWKAVKSGIRPERLPNMDEDCWLLMSSCWDSNVSNRPFLGNVEIRLNKILSNCINSPIIRDSTNTRQRKRHGRHK